ncbi:MAG: hypothetical protein K0B37_10255 [Bacteroidales bacterium]|nr:hypothetical protein [Bacteroidales bacterium]
MATIKEVTSFADIKVQIVSSNPDLFVYVTKTKSEAKSSDGIWYFDNSFPDKKVQFVKNFADLKIQYVNSKREAGWKNRSHKLQNRIG